jgi:hypothetical protein
MNILLRIMKKCVPYERSAFLNCLPIWASIFHITIFKEKEGMDKGK